MKKTVRITHRGSGELIAEGPVGWGITPFEGNWYISSKHLRTAGFRATAILGLCPCKFVYLWLHFRATNGHVTKKATERNPPGHMSGASTVDLVFFEGCPNVDQSRANLRDALELAGRAEAWTEWDLGSPSTPEQMRHLASPSILVNGRDVTGSGADGHGESNPTGMSCRVGGAPSIDIILAALSAI